MFIAQEILSTKPIFRGTIHVTDPAHASRQSLPFRTEHFADPGSGGDLIRPAAGEEDKIPCLKGAHSDKAATVTVNGRGVKIEETGYASSEETIYLVNGNKVALNRAYDRATEKVGINLGDAGYVQKEGPGGYGSRSLTVRTADQGVVRLSERDEQALYQFWNDAVAGLGKRRRAHYEITPLYPKPQAPARGRTRRNSAEPIQ